MTKKVLALSIFIVLITLGLLVLLNKDTLIKTAADYLASRNLITKPIECKDGGFAGYMCDCKGLKVKVYSDRENVADGMTIYNCYGTDLSPR